MPHVAPLTGGGADQSAADGPPSATKARRPPLGQSDSVGGGAAYAGSNRLLVRVPQPIEGVPAEPFAVARLADGGIVAGDDERVSYRWLRSPRHAPCSYSHCPGRAVNDATAEPSTRPRPAARATTASGATTAGSLTAGAALLASAAAIPFPIQCATCLQRYARRNDGGGSGAIDPQPGMFHFCSAACLVRGWREHAAYHRGRASSVEDAVAIHNGDQLPSALLDAVGGDAAAVADTSATGFAADDDWAELSKAR